MKRPSADIPKDRSDSDEKEKDGKRARIVTIETDTTQPQQQDIPIPTVKPDPLHKIANEGHSIDIALVDLFAGLRTVHVAAKTTRINFVLCASAEKCPFANKLAKNNKIYEKLFTDVKHMDKDWAKAFVADELSWALSAFSSLEVFHAKACQWPEGKAERT